MSTTREIVEKLRETARMAPYFQCACCGQTKERKHLGAVRGYEPDSPQLRARMVTPCAYAICEDCKDLPSKERLVKVTQYLATQGVFGD